MSTFCWPLFQSERPNCLRHAIPTSQMSKHCLAKDLEINTEDLATSMTDREGWKKVVKNFSTVVA